MKKLLSTSKVLAIVLAAILIFTLFGCKKEPTELNGTYMYMLGGEIPTFSYVFEGVFVTMYVGGELQAEGTYYISDSQIYMTFEVSTTIGRYDAKEDMIILTTSDYGDIELWRVEIQE